MDALSRVRQEIATVVSEIRLPKALAYRVLCKEELKIEPGDKV